MLLDKPPTVTTHQSCSPSVGPHGLRRCLRGLSSALLALCLLAGLTSPVSAHAIVIASSPRRDAIVAPGPMLLELDYNSRIDRLRSRGTLQRPDGSSVTLSWLDGAGPTALRANVQLDAEGSYVVRWQVLSDDGHITRGTVPFRVAAAKAQR